MQIHELTQTSLNEGFMDKLKSASSAVKGAVGPAIDKIGQANKYTNTKLAQAGNKIMDLNKQAHGAMPGALQRMTGDYAGSAAGVAQSMEKKGFGTQYQKPSDKWEDKLKQIEQNPGINQWANSVTAAWKKAEAGAVQAAPSAPNVPGAVPAAGSNLVMPPIFIGGKQIDPNDPKNASIVKSYMAQHGNTPVTEDARQMDSYRQAFIDWSDAKFATKDPTTYEQITMDDVRRLPGIGVQLSNLLDIIVQTQGTPQQDQAIAKYAQLATAGVQAIGQQTKNKNPGTRVTLTPTDNSTNPDILKALAPFDLSAPKLSAAGQALRTSTRAPREFSPTGNGQVDALLIAMGFRPR